jgi:RNA polymerase sigma-70 factor (ECF subfamily)
MQETELLGRRFEDHRERLQMVAYRMLGSMAEADDAVQESWLRISGADTESVDNLGGWLTTVVGRICLDRLRSRNARREETLEGHEPEPSVRRGHERTPDEDVELAESVGLALLVVLETLKPAERVAFVLHDMFDLSFDEIAPVVGRTPVATRQLASRARRRVQGASASGVDQRRKLEVVDAFIAAARSGDFAALMEVLDPGIILRTDAELVRRGVQAELHGASAIAGIFNGRAQFCVPGLIDGELGILLPVEGEMRAVVELSFSGGKIAAMHAVADRETIASLKLEQLGTAGGDMSSS